MDLFVAALLDVLSPLNALLLVCSVVVGIFVGAVPGLTATMACALLVPLTYGFPAEQSFISLIGIYCGAIYGGSVTAILLGIPGTPASAATMQDGYPLARKGMAGQTLGMACLASGFGGALGALVMIFLSPQISRISLLFGPAEYFSIAFFALSVLVLLSGKSLLKGFTAIILGVSFTFVGIEPISGTTRFTFGSEALINGVGIIPVAVGFFGFTQVFDEISRVFGAKVKTERFEIHKLIPKWDDIRSSLVTMLKSSGIGVFVGIIPGIGPETSCWLGYAEAKRSSKRSKEFGTGVMEGVAASEAANNATCGGAMIPMLTLGVPGDAPTAILLGGLILHGLPIGPLLFRDHMNFVYPVFAAFLLANIIMGLLGIGLARVFARVVNIRSNVMLPIISIFCFIGAYATQLSLLDVGLALFFGMMGFFLKRNDFPLSPIVVAVILGPMIEMNLANAMMIGGKWWTLFTKPIGATFIGLGSLLIIWTVITKTKKGKVQD